MRYEREETEGGEVNKATIKDYAQGIIVGLIVSPLIEYAYNHGGAISSTGCALFIIALASSVILAVHQRRAMSTDRTTMARQYRKEAARRYLRRA